MKKKEKKKSCRNDEHGLPPATPATSSKIEMANKKCRKAREAELTGNLYVALQLYSQAHSLATWNMALENKILELKSKLPLNCDNNTSNKKNRDNDCLCPTRLSFEDNDVNNNNCNKKTIITSIIIIVMKIKNKTNRLVINLEAALNVLNNWNSYELKNRLKRIGDVKANTIIQQRPFNSIEDFAKKLKFKNSLMDFLYQNVQFFQSKQT